MEAPPPASEEIVLALTMATVLEKLLLEPTWKIFGKLVAVPLPLLVTLAEKLTALPAVADDGDKPPEPKTVRSGRHALGALRETAAEYAEVPALLVAATV